MPHRLRAGVILALVQVATQTAAQDVCGLDQDRLVIDHSSRSAQLQVGGSRFSIYDGDEPRVATGAYFVEVTRTNTALFSFSVTAETFEAEELGAIRGFVGALGPYFVEAARQLAARRAAAAGAVDPVEQALEALAQSLKALSEDLRRLDIALFGAGGIRDVDIKVAAAFRVMSVPPADVPRPPTCAVVPPALTGLEAALAPNVDVHWKSVENNKCGHVYRPLDEVAFKVIATLEALYPDIALHRENVRRSMEHLRDVAGAGAATPSDAIRTLLAQAEAVLASARQALADSGTVVAESRRVENTVRLALGARTAWCSSAFNVSRSTGRKVTIAITARPGAPIVSHQQPLSFAASLRPDWLVRPSLGLSFLMARTAEYPTYTVAEANGGFRVAQSGLQDSRFTYGLTLGLTWRGLDRRDDHGAAIWLPELTVNPTSDTRAIGVGLAVSFFRFVKIGTGYLWTRHVALDGLTPDQPLASKDALRTREAYGDPRWYWSVSLIGWAPFVKD